MLTLKILAYFVAIVGVFSFVCLVLAIGTDFWAFWIVDASNSSHSGLWRVCNSQNQCQSLENPFGHTKKFTDSERQILNMQGTFIVLLPLSVIIMIVGGMLGSMGMLARAYLLLMMTGVLLLFGALVSLSGICVYIAWSAAPLKGMKTPEDLNMYFGWSLALASLSFITEFFTAISFFLASSRVGQQRGQDQDI